MKVQRPDRAYHRTRALIEKLGGAMTFHAGGGPGGSWELTLDGRTRWVEVRNHQVNDLDRLYQPAVKSPRTWSDYNEGAPLLPDAVDRLRDLFD